MAFFPNSIKVRIKVQSLPKFGRLKKIARGEGPPDGGGERVRQCVAR